MSESNIIDNFDIKTSLEYYDTFQPKITEILKKIYYIKTINNKNITDEIIFYDKNKKEIFKSSFELLAAYVPNQQVWKWAWSLPSLEKKSNIISRKILDYAFNLDHNKDFLLKSTLINSKIKIVNDLQLDIHIALSANLTRKPFIFKFFYAPLTSEEDIDFYPYKKINESPDNINYIAFYLFILDFEN